MEFFNRFKNALFLIAVLLAQAIALAVQVRTPADAGKPDGHKVRLIRMWTTSTVTPFERVAYAIGSGTRNGWQDYIDLRHVRQQNRDLEQQLTRMRIEQAAIAEDALQGRRLQALLAFKQSYVGSTVAAQVIGESGSDTSHVLTIDKGSNNGLKPDMPVITQDGIVGKLRDVFPDTSQVLEINDLSSGAGVILATTRIRAILRGTLSGRVQIENLTADSRIKPGEQVLTSGGDQVYPRGLPVGTIESIAPDPDRQPYTDIAVRPAVDLNRVEEVLVITQTQSDLPPLAQQDLAAAEAQHAADLTAERLPSIHDADPNLQLPGAAAAPVAAASPDAKTPPVVAIPHPLPALHPDRFSPGSSPPASNLIPGAPNSSPNTSSPSNPPSSQPSSRKPQPPQASPPPEPPQ